MDVSGIQKVPGGGYVTLPDGYGYFANLEDRDCGVPILREVGVVRSGAKILVAAEKSLWSGRNSTTGVNKTGRRWIKKSWRVYRRA